MKTLRILAVGALCGAVASPSLAADEPSVMTITVTAKRAALTPAVERVAPDEVVDAALLIGDMPEAEIDYHVTPIGTPAGAVPKHADQTRRL